MEYVILNYFFFFFHTVLIIFNSLGWIFKKFRKWNLITLLLTVFSWFILGIWYGWGYCPCTYWHWEVRSQLGFQLSSNSYIHFLILELTGINISESLVNSITFIVFFSSLFLSFLTNIRDYKRK